MTTRELTLKVKKIVILHRRQRTDIITIDLDTETTFPEMKYPPYASIETRHGYGETWCRKFLGEPDEVINANFSGL